MPAKNDGDYLLDMLRYAEHAVGFIEGRLVTDLDADNEFSFALQHCFMIIGEAAASVSDQT
ncbi:MAG TPA: hypothetical protein VGN88_01155 [Phycisphaerae bacterium]|jgi:uncharacterized protein with HEPN domain